MWVVADELGDLGVVSGTHNPVRLVQPDDPLSLEVEHPAQVSVVRRHPELFRDEDEIVVQKRQRHDPLSDDVARREHLTDGQWLRRHPAMMPIRGTGAVGGR